ncbi:hypothetical protein OfM1_13810 [Lactovum odontotermitis]
MKKYLPWNSITSKRDKIAEVVIFVISIVIARFVSEQIIGQAWLMSFLLGLIVLITVDLILSFAYVVISEKIERV